jgi:hypothetical protein
MIASLRHRLRRDESSFTNTGPGTVTRHEDGPSGYIVSGVS